ncbi:MAG TPA: hypothetical protein PLF08_06400 [Bacillota bacterium]|nr:hypothetical protein [Bacillota bacterium]HPZ78730.1 hypothetical protein [Bacillota bacterium]HQD74802.1 hypothetical protein [Bacillota bacterium]
MDDSRSHRYGKLWFAVAIIAGIGLGNILSLHVSPYLFDYDKEMRFLRSYDEFRDVVWEIGEGFRPDGYRVIGVPERRVDSHVVFVSPGWYANGNKYGFAVPLALQENAWFTTQVALAYADDEDGFAIVVNMVFARREMGKKPVAFPISRVARGASELLPPDWLFVASHDNMLLFFQLLPIIQPGSEASIDAYPYQWVEKAQSFVSEFQLFMDKQGL